MTQRQTDRTDLGDVDDERVLKRRVCSPVLLRRSFRRRRIPRLMRYITSFANFSYSKCACLPYSPNLFRPQVSKLQFVTSSRHHTYSEQACPPLRTAHGIPLFFYLRVLLDMKSPCSHRQAQGGLSGLDIPNQALGEGYQPHVTQAASRMKQSLREPLSLPWNLTNQPRGPGLHRYDIHRHGTQL